MFSKPHEYAMGDDVFFIHRIPAFEAVLVYGAVQKAIAPLAKGAANGLKGVDLDAEITDMSVIGGVVGEALFDFAMRMDGETLQSLARMLINPEYIAVRRKGEKEPVRLTESVADEIFEGRVIDMLVLMVQIAKVNFADFSRLSSIPAGVRAVFGELRTKFREKFQGGLNGES